MATIKAYTDISQSKKLSEILPLESADMHYCLEKRDVATGYEIGIVPFIQARRFKGKCNITDVQPAWSLAALLDVLPKIDNYRLEIRHIDKGYCCCYTEENNGGDLYWYYADNPVDAAFEMICCLFKTKRYDYSKYINYPLLSIIIYRLIY